MCVYVCIPLFLNIFHVPPLSRMGQQVSRSLARTLPVLFWTNWLPRRGCQSSQPFPFHPAALQPLWPQLLCSKWYEQIQFDVPLLHTDCIFHYHFVQFHFMCNHSVFGRCLIDLEIFFINLVALVIDRLLLLPALWKPGLFITSFCPYLTDWNSLQCHSHLRPIFVYSFPCNNSTLPWHSLSRTCSIGLP